MTLCLTRLEGVLAERNHTHTNQMKARITDYSVAEWSHHTSVQLAPAAPSITVWFESGHLVHTTLHSHPLQPPCHFIPQIDAADM